LVLCYAGGVYKLRERQALQGQGESLFDFRLLQGVFLTRQSSVNIEPVLKLD
jgi:hypothetical protein